MLRTGAVDVIGWCDRLVSRCACWDDSPRPYNSGSSCSRSAGHASNLFHPGKRHGAATAHPSIGHTAHSTAQRKRVPVLRASAICVVLPFRVCARACSDLILISRRNSSPVRGVSLRVAIRACEASRRHHRDDGARWSEDRGSSGGTDEDALCARTRACDSHDCARGPVGIARANRSFNSGTLARVLIRALH